MKKMIAGLLTFGMLVSAAPSVMAATTGMEMPSDSQVSATQAYLPTVSTLSDVAGNWAANEINDMLAMRAVTGYPDKTFKPNKYVTRAEFASALKAALNVPNADELAELKDVPSTLWAAKSISAVLPYLAAYPDGSFRPNAAATREDVAVAIVNAAGLSGKAVDPNTLDLMFKDYKAISPDLKQLVAVAVDQKLIKGYAVESATGQYTGDIDNDNTDETYDLYIKPQNFITRAEMCFVLDQARLNSTLGVKTLPSTEE